MLYLEDYLEMIEHLPQELRDRFTEMRELDLTVQNNMDSLEKKTRAFFMQCKRGELQDEAADSEYQNLRKEYYKVLEDADEKVTIATQIHELVERYLRRLDSELFKFKCELEADNNGITEILEKRSLEMDGGSSAATALLSVTGLNQKENRYYGGLGAAVAPSSSSSHNAVMGGAGLGMGGITVPATPTGATKDNRYRTPKPEKRRDSTSTLQNAVPEKRANLGNSLTPAGTPPVAVVRPITPSIGAVLNAAAGSVGTPSPVTYNLQQIGGSATTAIAAAATQAIVATQQMQQGRRSASMKASYEAIHGAGGGPTEFWISRDISNPTATASALGLANNSTEKSKKKYTSKKLNSNLSHNISTPNTTTAASAGALSLASSSSSLSVDSVDMLAASAPTNLNVPSLIPAGQHVTASSSNSLAAASSSSAAGSSRQALSSTSSTASASTSSSTSTALTPGSNITLNENGMVVEQTPDGEWSYDPNEPRYCTCNQVSYGDMVACDNDACPYEWFHYPCVGITQPPKGKWYCPKCTASMRRRGNRKN